MDKKTVGIIATIVAVLLCGCPGLCLSVFGVITASGKMPLSYEFPYTSDFGNQNSEMAPSYIGFVFLCLAMFLVAIPIVVGILTLRNRTKKPILQNEPPLPPR